MEMNENRAAAVVAELLAARIPGFAAQGFDVRRRNVVADMVANIGKHRVAIEVKSLPVSRVEDLVGRLAAGYMNASRIAAGMNAIPMVIVLVPVVGPKVVAAAADFMSSNVPDGGWAILDRAGNARIVIPEANIDIDHRMARVVPAQRGRRSVRLLSDLNRWMLKILLLAETPANLWPGPRSPILSPTDLHRVAGVSPEMAHRFVRAFEALDLLRRTPEGLRIARRSALLDLWRAEEVLDRRDGVPVRWMMGRLSNLQDLAGRGKSGEPDLVVAGFEACRMLGLLHAPIPAAREVHALVPVDAILLRYDLERCPPGDADLRLLPCRTVQSVLRGSLDHGGLRIVDAFQAALDVLHHPARGREQSDYLVTQVLHLEDER